jgi:hypothetical protein
MDDDNNDYSKGLRSSQEFLQLQSSSKLLRLHIPEDISEEVVTKILLQRKRSNDLPQNVIYAEEFNEKEFYSREHLVRCKASKWNFEIITATRTCDGIDFIIALIDNYGSTKAKPASANHHDHNNSRTNPQKLIKKGLKIG